MELKTNLWYFRVDHCGFIKLLKLLLFSDRDAAD